MISNSTLVVVVGPTAVGKTAVALDLAASFGGEIVSADSRQIYREMEIGTAKPSAEELSKIPHHLINSHSIEESYDAGQFSEDAGKIVADLLKRDELAVMVGGSGLYVKAFCDGFDEMPVVGADIRVQLNRELDTMGLEPLLSELKQADPVYFEQVDRKNTQRVIRALEVIRVSGKPFSSFRVKQKTVNHTFSIIKIGLELDREILYQRINERMDIMIAQGLFEEAKKLFPFRANNALQTVGYQEIFGFLEGKYDKEEAIRLLKRNSRRYAKRQMTWFKRDEEVTWFDPNDRVSIKEWIGNLRSSK